MGRRQKSASSEPQTLLRLREEAIVLKQLDLEKIAANHLVKSLSKAKRVRESPCFVTVYGTEPNLEGVKSTAEGNVLGRLFGSEPVRKAMAAAMAEVYRALDIEAGDGGARKESSGAVQFTKRSNKEDATISKRSRNVEEELDPMEITTDEEGSEDHGGDDGSFDVDSFEGFSDEEAAGNKVGTYDSQQPPSIPGSDSEAVDDDGVSISGSAPSIDSPEDISDSGSDSDVAESLQPQQPARRNNHPLKSDPPTTAATTAFLPSLSMGGYYHPGSDSDSEDEPEKIPIERKNRRGQQARRQIAEMKYGKNAKHLQNQAKTKDNAGWDVRKGAVSTPTGRTGGAGPRGGRDAKQGRGRGGSRSTGNLAGPKQVAEKPKTRDDSGPVHPSWEAAKARKQQAAVMASGAAAFTGKKITFD
jgi:hypothetical protein